MPRPGGRRQGTPGRNYQNRTDLAVARAPQTGTSTAATGGYLPPGGYRPPPGTEEPTTTNAVLRPTPDQVPRLDDPTARPNEPLTAGLATGPGAGPEALGPMPQSPDVMRVQAAYLNNPTPELRRTLFWLYGQGAL